MGLFSKRSPSAAGLAGLPGDFGETVARLGRQSVHGPGFPTMPPELVVTLWQLSQRDRTLFYRVLSESAESRGGWGWVGAAWVVKDVGPTGYQDDSGHDFIMEAAMSFLRSQGVALATLPPIQQDWWFARHEGETW